MSLVLVVDDKEMMRDSVGSTLRRAGFEIATAPSGRDALASIARRRPDAVVTDLKMPGMTGVELLEQIAGLDDELPVVLMTAFGTIETAVEAIKLGAFDYITKPFEGDELVIAVKRAIRHGSVVRENAVLRASAPDTASPIATNGAAGAAAGPSGLDRLVGSSAAMRRVREQVAAVAGSHGTVLICGESGTGKEVVARAVHDMSPRAPEPFLAVNCAALSDSLLESELFGHERGAFTGAERLRKGRFELADRGSLLLDEVSEVSHKTQAKLLRVLQERAFERVGSSTTIGVDVRVIATSNRDLPATVAHGGFRQDLYFRLNVLPVQLPPLRERASDIPELAEHFGAQIAERDGRRRAAFDEGAIGLMQSYAWPGNVRELQNVVERAIVLLSGQREPVVRREMIEPWLAAQARAARAMPLHAAARPAEDTRTVVGGLSNGSGPAVIGSVGAPTDAIAEVKTEPSNGQESRDGAVLIDDATGGVRTLEDIERDAIVMTLRRFNGHRQKTARTLGIGVRTLGLKLKKWKELELVEASL
ncbi:MAG: sigma-54 dependent transcriptional regulator [Planctomycetota bacterium]